jgi:coenzyme F420 hydrogenase subunit beta
MDGDKLAFPQAKSKPYVRVGCQVCLDFAAELADISVGAVGTPGDYSTVVARNRKGQEIIEGAAREGYIELKPIEEVKPGVSLVKKLTDGKRTENLEEAQKREEAGFPVLHIKTLGEKDLENTKQNAKGKNFTDLNNDIIENGLCVACGTCEAVCSEGCVEVEEEHPRQVKECAKDCNACYLMCPRTSLPQLALEEMAFDGGEKVPGVGVATAIYAAKTTNAEVPGQDGGAVTAILSYALDKGLIDRVSSVKSAEDPWRPEVQISSTKEELQSTAGTLYSHAVIIPEVKRSVSQ